MLKLVLLGVERAVYVRAVYVSTFKHRGVMELFILFWIKRPPTSLLYGDFDDGA